MHQPLIPAGGHDLQSAGIISNLKYMMDNPGIGDNHDAPVFHWCYKRMGEFVPQLVDEGKQPRIMLEYSGALLHGLRHVGLNDVFDNLKRVTGESKYQGTVEWLGCPWGHAVVPSTPVQDFRLQVRAWQHHFAAIFGFDALARVRGFSPSEMALPNHPDIAYEFVKTLKDCGFGWVLVQEHTIEDPQDGSAPKLKHIPHRLICRNSRGKEATIIAIIKHRGTQPKTVGADKGYHQRAFVEGCRQRQVSPHVICKDGVQVAGLDARTTGKPGYQTSRRIRQRVEEIFGWIKTVGGLRRTRYRGRERTQAWGYFVAGTYNLLRMVRLESVTNA